MFEDIFLNLIPIIAVICVFMFLSTVIWTKQRRREREAYYRHELAKSMIARGADADEIARMLRRSSSTVAERREALRLGGLLTLAVGVGFMVGFQWIPAPEPIWMIGSVPTLLGVAMLIYAFTARANGDSNAA